MIFLSPFLLLVFILGVVRSKLYLFSPLLSVKVLLSRKIKISRFISFLMITVILLSSLAFSVYKVSSNPVFINRFIGYEENASSYELRGNDPPKRILILSSFTHCASSSVSIASSTIHKCIGSIDDYDNTWLSAYYRGGLLNLFAYIFIFIFNLRIFFTFSSVSLLSLFSSIWFILYSLQADLTNSPLLFTPLIIAFAHQAFNINLIARD